MPVQPIPAEYVDILASVKRQYGIPISWLAAVCNQAGWNPTLRQYNLIPGWQSFRRFGLAGVWGELSEIWLAFIEGDTWGTGCGHSSNPCNMVPVAVAYPAAGWFPWLICGPICGLAQRWTAPATLVAGYTAGDLTVSTNLALATKILLDSATWVQGKCGEYNSLIFARYILGARMPWVFDANGKCVIPPDLPPWVTTEVTELVAAQVVYADQLGEPPLIPPTIECDLTHPCPSPLVCVSGYCVLPSQGGISPLAWGLLGLMGLVGIVGLVSGGNKRGQAERLRQDAMRLRGRASALRAQAATTTDPRLAAGLNQQATDLERRADQEESEASRLETAAAQDEYAKTQRQYR